MYVLSYAWYWEVERVVVCVVGGVREQGRVVGVVVYVEYGDGVV